MFVKTTAMKCVMSKSSRDQSDKLKLVQAGDSAWG